MTIIKHRHRPRNEKNDISSCPENDEMDRICISLKFVELFLARSKKLLMKSKNEHVFKFLQKF